MTGPMMLVKNISYYNLSLRWRGNDNQIQRRWFIDPLTEMLLLQISLTMKLTKATPWYYLRTFFKEMQVSSNNIPGSIHKLINAFSLMLQLDVPSFLIGYANHKNLSHSLKGDAWLRLHNKAGQASDNIELDLDITADKDFPTLVSDWDAPIKQALKKKTQRQALQALKHINIEQNSIPLLEHIKAWAIFLLSKGSKFGRKLAVTTVQTYVSRLSYRLYTTIGEYDLTKFDSETFEDIYTEILENEDASQRTIAQILREFHHFLVSKYDIPELNSSILDTRNLITPVNANIISIEEYLATLELISNNISLQILHPDIPVIGRLLIILAFRCGLRRKEVLKLRLIDFQGEVAPEILIRPHSERRLKTKNSTRRLRLNAWLTENELTDLKNWVSKRRMAEDKQTYSEYIFSIPEKHYAFVPEELIFPAIHKLLREATSDESISFHSLRHSCASWNTLRLLVADIGLPERFFKDMSETLKYLQTSKAVKKSCYSHDEPTRKHLYVISALLGHSSPSITLEHYIHCCDILLYRALEKVHLNIPKQVLLNASGLPQATAYRLLSRGTDNIIRTLRKKHTDKYHVFSEPLQPLQVLNTDDAPNMPWFRIMQAWKLLFLHSKYNRPLETLTNELGYTLHEANTLVTQALKFSSLKRKGRHKTPRFRFMDSEGKRLLCPNQPRTHEGKALAADFAQRLFNLSQENNKFYTTLIRIYLSNARYNSNELVFAKSQDAISWIFLLKQIGIAHKHLTFTWCYGVKIKGIKNSERKQYWRESLNIPKKQPIQVKKINNTRPLGRNGAISIRINDYLHSDSQPGQSTEAFRFVITMLATLETQKS